MRRNDGYTVLELLVAMIVISIISLAVWQFFNVLLQSTILVKKQSAALELSTNHMEYIRSLPYDRLGIDGGSISVADPLPGQFDKTVDNITYTIYTSIRYIDDAFDNCFSYSSTADKLLYCRGSVEATPTTDSNPADYKTVNIKVRDKKTSALLSEADTRISARVAETASSSGAIIVEVTDSTGIGLPNASACVENLSLSPQIEKRCENTDNNGKVVFYNLPPDDVGYYTMSASKDGYESITTVPPSSAGDTPRYPSKHLIIQRSIESTLQLLRKAPNSMVIKAIDMSGNPIENLELYYRGGIKIYSNESNDEYSTSSTKVPSNTNADGFTTLVDLVSGDYFFCDEPATNACKVGATTYKVAAAIPGVGSSYQASVPIFSDSYSGLLFNYNSVDYVQQMKLVMTSNLSDPSILSSSPENIQRANTNMSAVSVVLNGVNMNNITAVNFRQGTKTSAATLVKTLTSVTCTADLSTFQDGYVGMEVSVSGGVFVPYEQQAGGLTGVKIE